MFERGGVGVKRGVWGEEEGDSKGVRRMREKCVPTNADGERRETKGPALTLGSHLPGTLPADPF